MTNQGSPASSEGAGASLPPPDAASGLRARDPEPLEQRSMFVVALVAASVGWAIFGFFALLHLFAGEDENCTGNRGEAYRDCVRNSDLTGLRIQGVVMGLAMMASTVAVIGAIRQHALKRSDSQQLPALFASGSLVAVSIGGWAQGARGFWAPERPFPYDPVSTGQGNTTMLVGGLVGLLVGALVGVVMTYRK